MFTRTKVTHRRLAGDPGWRLRTVILALFLTTWVAGVAQGQMTSGDILLNVFNNTPRVVCFRPDGTHRWTSSGGTGTDWLGCAVTRQGHVVVTRRTPTIGVNVFDSSGAQIHQFLTPQVAGLTGDVSVFSDGTLAIVDQNAKVHLYTEGGTYLSSMQSAGLQAPFGCYIDRHDNLFLCDVTSAGQTPGSIQKLSRSGQWLATFPLSFIPGDVVVAPDDTLWIADRNSHKVVHLSSAG